MLGYVESRSLMKALFDELPDAEKQRLRDCFTAPRSPLEPAGKTIRGKSGNGGPSSGPESLTAELKADAAVVGWG